jgi:hypothetical protein
VIPTWKVLRTLAGKRILLDYIDILGSLSLPFNLVALYYSPESRVQRI